MIARYFLGTFGVVSGIKLKQLHRVVWKTVYVDPVLQNDDYPWGAMVTNRKGEQGEQP